VTDDAGWTIRPAAPDDWPAVVAVAQSAYSEHDWPDYVQNVVGAIPEDPYVRAFLAVDADGRPIGSVRVDTGGSNSQAWRDDDVSLRMLSVLPEWRGRGVASALIDAVEDLARRSGAEGVSLHTTVALARAAEIYQHLGYVREPAGDRPLPSGNILMGWRKPLR
jgi:GNAT superfamily N-acetyltransferase